MGLFRAFLEQRVDHQARTKARAFIFVFSSSETNHHFLTLKALYLHSDWKFHPTFELHFQGDRA